LGKRLEPGESFVDMKTICLQQCASLVMAGAVLGLLNGCWSHEHASGTEHSGHDHSGEAKTAQITAFGERHETTFFAGTPPS
jgi:hypothetical protein